MVLKANNKLKVSFMVRENAPDFTAYFPAVNKLHFETVLLES